MNEKEFAYIHKSGTDRAESLDRGMVDATYTYEPQTGQVDVVSTSGQYNGNTVTLYSSDYGYSANDQRTGRVVSDQLPDGSSRGYSLSFGYDGLDQLALVGISGAAPLGIEVTYGWDGVGNPSGWSVNGLNQRAGWTYDARGNLTGDGTHTYQWDGLDRLSRVEAINPGEGSQAASFEYDTQGRRIAKRTYTWDVDDDVWSLTKTTQFAYDGWVNSPRSLTQPCD